MMGCMKRFDLFLSKVQLKRIKAISKKKGRSIAELIRQAIDEWLDKEEKKGSE
jgi:predicted DNA-binding protein